MCAQALHVDRRVAGIPNDDINHHPSNICEKLRTNLQILQSTHRVGIINDDIENFACSVNNAISGQTESQQGL
jgi:pterin-4a-carbinolamine dehydratase